MCIYSVNTPSVGVVELVEYFCTHPDIYVVASEEDSDFVVEDVE